ncbi:hypothetical protein HNP71_002804 [Acidocella aromatica]|uniref:Uncharacterized protein n=2 Tax=Acidocella aromatica TaxID=1303579 RepID=A0A840VQZ2_9PROT|nr:hypothetical protein [Acidocella aromatica]
MKMQETFEEAGFLSRQAKRSIHDLRAGSRVSFDLAYDLNELMMRTALAAMNAAQGHNWTQQTVAVRLLLRTSESFQGVILLSERGMVSPARALVRMIVEDSLCAAALLEKPDEVIRMLRDDAETSRRGQAAFISEQQLGDDPAMLAKLRAAVETMEKKNSRIDWKKMAKISTMLPQYLNYQRLSDGAVHTSASSLDRHIVRDPEGNGWTYRIGPGEPGDIDATLHRGILAAIPVALVVTQVVPDSRTNAALVALESRFLALPTGNTV